MQAQTPDFICCAAAVCSRCGAGAACGRWVCELRGHHLPFVTRSSHYSFHPPKQPQEGPRTHTTAPPRPPKTQEPTQAELDPSMQAIVVSRETLRGAQQINAGRARRGFPPLVVVVVPVMGSCDPAAKLSSSQLRAADVAAEAAGAAAAAARAGQVAL